jgi:hypothetical protein
VKSEHFDLIEAESRILVTRSWGGEEGMVNKRRVPVGEQILVFYCAVG